MIKYWLLFSVCLAVMNSPTLADQIISSWTDTVMTIDGDGDEWHKATFSYYDDNSTAIATCNDSLALYIIVISRHEPTIMQMERTGIMVWLSGEGKKKRDFGMRYCAGRLSKEPRKFRGEGAAPPTMRERFEEVEEERDRLRSVITVVAKNNVTEIPAKSDEGPAAAATFGKDVYAIEYRIPLFRGDSDVDGIAIKDKAKLTIGLEFGYRTEKEKEEMRDRMDERGGGMRIGMGGQGGFGGGENGPPGGGMMKREDSKREIWLDVVLAKQ